MRSTAFTPLLRSTEMYQLDHTTRTCCLSISTRSMPRASLTSKPRLTEPGLHAADLHTFDRPEQNACAALLAFVSLLWCTEALPLFVTSMLVPLLTVLLRVLVDSSDPQHPQRLTPKQAAPRIFHAMFSQVTTHQAVEKVASLDCLMCPCKQVRHRRLPCHLPRQAQTIASLQSGRHAQPASPPPLGAVQHAHNEAMANGCPTASCKEFEASRGLHL